MGEKAVRINTPTAGDVGGRLEEIDTRIPPARELHEVDFADVLGKKPVVLLFATPRLCQSRVCGPVADITAQVQADERFRDKVAFVMMEIYNENEISKGFRPQVGAWRLPSEPWAFVIDGDGKVSDRFEGAFSVSELTAAVEKVADT